MAKIYVGNEYAGTFESIAKMYSQGCVPEGLIKSADANRIVTAAQEFVLTKGRGTTKDAGADATIGEDGASWFAVFRGAKPLSRNAEWLMFVETVKEYFHRNYSLVEYCPRDYRLSADEAALQKENISRFLRLFYPGYAFEIYRGDEQEGIEDIYGASLRMELTDGTGEAVPVLGKVFFRKTPKGILAYGKDDAENINKYLQAFDKPQDNYASSQNSLELTDTVIDALDRLVHPAESSEYILDDCIIFASDNDKKAVEIMVEKGPNERVDILCVSMSVMNISHVRWQNDSYNIRLGDKTVLKANVGIGGKFNLWCNNCRKKTPLVESDKIKFSYGGKKKLLVIDLAREDFGIPADILAEIKASGVFSKHIVKICCNENIRLAGACVRYVCDGDSITLDDGQIKCKNCPYPEVTFACEDGVVRYTANLAFARDRMTLVPKDKVVECECCKRNFYSEEKKDGFVCDFCRTAKIGIAGMDYSDYKEGNKLYRKYAGMLPLSLRVQNIRKHKYCKEDEDCILFILNKTTLIFYKEKLGEKGFLPSPEKIEL